MCLVCKICHIDEDGILIFFILLDVRDMKHDPLSCVVNAAHETLLFHDGFNLILGIFPNDFLREASVLFVKLDDLPEFLGPVSPRDISDLIILHEAVLNQVILSVIHKFHAAIIFILLRWLWLGQAILSWLAQVSSTATS